MTSYDGRYCSPSDTSAGSSTGASLAVREDEIGLILDDGRTVLHRRIDDRCGPGGIAKERDVADADAREGEHQRVASRVVAGPPDQLDARATSRHGQRDPACAPVRTCGLDFAPRRHADDDDHGEQPSRSA